MMIRVCHIISGDLWAGAETMACQLLRGLHAKTDIELSVIVLNEGLLADKLGNAGIRTTIIDERTYSFFQIFSRAKEVVRTFSPQIIHAHRYKENLLAYLLSRMSGCRPMLVSTQHGMPELYDGAPRAILRLKTFINFTLLANAFNATVAVSLEIRKALANRIGFDEKRLAVIHNGVDVPESCNSAGQRCTIVIGSAGRFFPVKDYLLMVEVAREVQKSTDKITFQLAGEGPMLRAIQEAIGKYGLEKAFKIQGFTSDMETFYGGLDMYINTSIHEGIPMSVLEAMSRGLPAIAPRVGGLAEIITDGRDGYLVDGRNPSGFAEKCLLLAADAELRGRMAVAARSKIVDKFSVGRMVADYLALYQRITASDNQNTRL